MMVGGKVCAPRCAQVGANNGAKILMNISMQANSGGEIIQPRPGLLAGAGLKTPRTRRTAPAPCYRRIFARAEHFCFPAQNTTSPAWRQGMTQCVEKEEEKRTAESELFSVARSTLSVA